jgi:hypothetical protein
MFQNKVENKKHFLQILNANAQNMKRFGNTAIHGKPLRFTTLQLRYVTPPVCGYIQ